MPYSPFVGYWFWAKDYRGPIFVYGSPSNFKPWASIVNMDNSIQFTEIFTFLALRLFLFFLSQLPAQFAAFFVDISSKKKWKDSPNPFQSNAKEPSLLVFFSFFYVRQYNIYTSLQIGEKVTLRIHRKREFMKFSHFHSFNCTNIQDKFPKRIFHTGRSCANKNMSRVLQLYICHWFRFFFLSSFSRSFHRHSFVKRRFYPFSQHETNQNHICLSICVCNTSNFLLRS